MEKTDSLIIYNPNSLFRPFCCRPSSGSEHLLPTLCCPSTGSLFLKRSRDEENPLFKNLCGTPFCLEVWILLPWAWPPSCPSTHPRLTVAWLGFRTPMWLLHLYVLFWQKWFYLCLVTPNRFSSGTSLSWNIPLVTWNVPLLSFYLLLFMKDPARAVPLSTEPCLTL